MFGSGDRNDIDKRVNDALDASLDAALDRAIAGGRFERVFTETMGRRMRDLLTDTIKKELFGGGGVFSELAGGGVGSGALGMLKGILPGAGAGKSGGLVKTLLGSELSFFGGGLGGVLGGFGMLASLPVMFSKGNQRPGMSDVDAMFGDAVRMRGGDLSALFGSDEFERAVFSSRNAGGELFRRFADVRLSPHAAPRATASADYDADVEDGWMSTSRLNEMAGIPRRTNFNHG